MCKPELILFLMILHPICFSERTLAEDDLSLQNRQLLNKVIESNAIISARPEFAFIEQGAKRGLASSQDFQLTLAENAIECNWILQMKKGTFKNKIIHVVSCVSQQGQQAINEIDENRLSALFCLATGCANATFDRIETTGQNRIIVIEVGPDRDNRIRRQVLHNYIQVVGAEPSRWEISLTAK